MQIGLLSSIYNKSSITGARNASFRYNNIYNTLQYDTVSFGAISNKHTQFQDFRKAAEKAYPNTPLNQILYNALTDENRIGEGTKKVVYSIPNIDNYVVGFLKKAQSDNKAPIEGYDNPFPEQNFGQAIAGNNADLIVMQKLDGASFSIPDWTFHFKNLVYQNEPITQKEAQIFLSQARKIEQLPIEAYVYLAEQIKYLSDKGIKIDSINPNNVLVDYDSKKLRYIDLFEDPSKFEAINPKNSTHDMINLLTDSLLHAEYIAALDDTDADELKAITKSIIKKCKKAGKIAGLSSSSSPAIEMMSLIQNNLMKKFNRNPNYLKCYAKFCALYDKEIS